MAEVILQGAGQISPEYRDQVVAGVGEVVRWARELDGCLEYTIASDPLEPGRWILAERWASVEDFNQYLEKLESRMNAGRRASRPGRPLALKDEVFIFEAGKSDLFQRITTDGVNADSRKVERGDHKAFGITVDYGSS